MKIGELSAKIYGAYKGHINDKASHASAISLVKEEFQIEEKLIKVLLSLEDERHPENERLLIK
jgi:hypothetical protein